MDKNIDILNISKYIKFLNNYDKMYIFINSKNY